MGFSPDVPRLLRTERRVGSCRDPKTERPLTRTFCFSISAIICSLVLEPDSAQRLTCDMTKRRAAGGRASAAEER